MDIPKCLVKKLGIFLNVHEKSCIVNVPCICSNFIHPIMLDSGLSMNYTIICKKIKYFIKKINLNTQRIHIIGEPWPLINYFKHRKFNFYSKYYQTDKNKSILITDVCSPIDKIKNKLIITQGYSKKYDLVSVDYLLIQKKYIKDWFNVSFENQIVENGFLVIDLKTSQKFYTEFKN